MALGREAVRILVQEAPARIDISMLHADLAAIPGVVDVHDLHVWTLTSEMEVASGTPHGERRAPTTTPCSTRRATVLGTNHGVAHATLQIEPDDHKGCDEVDW